MKQLACKKRSDMSFEVGDLVYLKLQPYRKDSLRKMRNQKLSPRFYGPYPIEAKIGQKHVGLAIHSPTLPLVRTGGSVLIESAWILDRRMVKKGNHAVTEVLVEWADTFPEDSTWEAWT
ncbi:reverse transcriptase [Gossypium australe]|uniref:Reverse transcriptase n=1 Tax=Gossypium australe TaxID=47621 RepID=A0A5B6WIQ6_9ROSI|nr:reverse transcriptase [Gossypium australe]